MVNFYTKLGKMNTKLYKNIFKSLERICFSQKRKKTGGYIKKC